jgi:hypothetical protein
LCLTSTFLFVFATVCLATGIFHHGGHHHHPTGSEAEPASALLDICAFAQQALLTTVAPPVALLPSLLPSGEALPRAVARIFPMTHGISHGIRAPPLVHV